MNRKHKGVNGKGCVGSLTQRVIDEFVNKLLLIKREDILWRIPPNPPPTVTTRCVINELKSLGKELSGAVYVAKRFQLRKCSHEGKRKSATECILTLIGQSTLHMYTYMHSTCV